MQIRARSHERISRFGGWVSHLAGTRRSMVICSLSTASVAAGAMVAYGLYGGAAVCHRQRDSVCCLYCDFVECLYLRGGKRTDALGSCAFLPDVRGDAA